MLGLFCGPLPLLLLLALDAPFADQNQKTLSKPLDWVFPALSSLHSENPKTVCDQGHLEAYSENQSKSTMNRATAILFGVQGRHPVRASLSPRLTGHGTTKWLMYPRMNAPHPKTLLHSHIPKQDGGKESLYGYPPQRHPHTMFPCPSLSGRETPVLQETLGQ